MESNECESEKNYFKEKADWYEKCLICQHSYLKNNDADMIYCRCRGGKCNFKEVEKSLKRQKGDE